MRSRWLFPMTLILFSFVLSLSAQQKAPPATADDFEKAHQGVFGSQPDKGAEASRLTATFAGQSSGDSQNAPIKNYVDEYIFGRMQRDKIPHAPLANDYEFVRRVYVDATGLLPTPAQIRDFVASNDSNKRDKLIDSLIGSDDFADQWAWFWSDLFQAWDCPCRTTAVMWTKNGDSEGKPDGARWGFRR